MAAGWGSRVRTAGLWLLVLAAMGGTGWAVATGRLSLGSSASQDGAGRRGPGGPVPVVAGDVSREDMPLWLDGIGTVQAFNNVVVRVRVDGELQRLDFREGQMVKAGEEMAVIDPRPYQAALAQAQAKRAQDEAQLANAKRDLERNLGLRDFASRQQVDTQRALVAQWEAQVKADQAAIDSAQVQLSYTTITAPISGRIGLRSIDQGNMVRAADATGLASISQIQPISIVFTLPEKDLPPVLEAQAAGPVTVVALDRDGKKPLGEGRLAVIDNQIDANTGTIRLKATLPNDPPRLWPGQFVNVRLLAATRRDATVIPAPAVQRGPQGTFVYVIKPDQTAEHRPVTVGPIEDGKALIEAGLTPGERIVVDGQYKLQAGAQVRIGEATPPPESQPQQRRDRKRDKS